MMQAGFAMLDAGPLPVKDIKNVSVWRHEWRVHVRGDLILHDEGRYASGGFLANVRVDGALDFGSQQQWCARNARVGGGGARGGAWSLVFVDSDGALPAARASARAAPNAKFGGDKPKGTKIFYTDFSDDPWQRASVTASPEKDSPYCYEKCDGCGHCGAGVPADVHDCSDKVDAWVDEMLVEDNVEEWLAASE